MSDATNSGPGYKQHPGHRITVEPAPSRVRVLLGGETIADSRSALLLREASYPPVYYIPIADIRADAIKPTRHSTYCPFKGDASYWSISASGKRAENALWAYQSPYDEVAAIKDHAAFYPSKVDAIEVDGCVMPV